MFCVFLLVSYRNCRNFHAYESDEFYNTNPEIYSEVNEAIDYARQQAQKRKNVGTGISYMGPLQSSNGNSSLRKHQALFSGYARESHEKGLTSESSQNKYRTCKVPHKDAGLYTTRGFPDNRGIFHGDSRGCDFLPPIGSLPIETARKDSVQNLIQQSQNLEANHSYGSKAKIPTKTFEDPKNLSEVTNDAGQIYSDQDSIYEADSSESDFRAVSLSKRSDSERNEYKEIFRSFIRFFEELAWLRNMKTFTTPVCSGTRAPKKQPTDSGTKMNRCRDHADLNRLRYSPEPSGADQGPRMTLIRENDVYSCSNPSLSDYREKSAQAKIMNEIFPKTGPRRLKGSGLRRVESIPEHELEDSNSLIPAEGSKDSLKTNAPVKISQFGKKVGCFNLEYGLNSDGDCQNHIQTNQVIPAKRNHGGKILPSHKSTKESSMRSHGKTTHEQNGNVSFLKIYHPKRDYTESRKGEGAPEHTFTNSSGCFGSQNEKSAPHSVSRSTKFRGYGTRPFPGPTLQFPDFAPVIALFSDRETFIYAEVGLLVDKSLLDIAKSINSYIASTTIAVNEPISAGATRIQTGLQALFSQTANLLSTGITQIFTSARAQLTQNLTLSDTNIIAQFDAMLEAALQNSLQMAGSYIQTAINQVQAYIEAAGASLLSQITNILADTTNASAILPQLDLISESEVQAILANVFASFADDISNILRTQYLQMEAILRNSTQLLITDQSAVVNNVEPLVTELIITDVTALLEGVSDLVLSESLTIANAASTAIRLSQPVLESEIETTINTLRDGIQKIFDDNFADIIRQMNLLLDQDELSLITQVRTIFATA